MDMPERLRSYIDREVVGAAGYVRLADMANDISASETLLEIARDKRDQADELMEVYHLLTGETHALAKKVLNQGGSFKDILLDCVMLESEGAVLYGQEAYLSTQHEQMKALFHRAAEKETGYTLRLLHLVQRT